MADDLIVVAVGLACVPEWLTATLLGAAAAGVTAAYWAVRQ
jgi:hypothetical protein